LGFVAVSSRPEGHELAVETSELTKVFGGERVVDSVDLEVPRGAIFGFLGPNGAGKTTTIRMLATLLKPTSGTARVFGHDVVREAPIVRRRISVTAQFASVDEDLTAAENLVLVAGLHGYRRRAARRRAADLLEGFDLGDAADRQVQHFSGGMRRRLDTAASMVVAPELLFLDEPTTGLDPRSRNHVWDVVRALVDGGTTVLLTTQDLDEADELADRIAVIDRGRVIAEGTRRELKASVGEGAFTVQLLDPEQKPAATRFLTERLAAELRDDRDPATLTGRVQAHDGAEEMGEKVADALAVLARSGVGVGGFTLGQPSLDEVFLALTGAPADAGGEAGDESG
jgi:ABC-2 type transport system ATP-binding protein